MMNWDQIKRNWKQASDKIKVTWGKFSEDDLAAIAGDRNLLTGMLARPGSIRSMAVKRDLDEVYHYFPRLRDFRKRTAGYLSGGEQQMVVIGRALMANLLPASLADDPPARAGHGAVRAAVGAQRGKSSHERPPGSSCGAVSPLASRVVDSSSSTAASGLMGLTGRPVPSSSPAMSRSRGWISQCQW